MIDNGFHGNMKHWMGWDFQSLGIMCSSPGTPLAAQVCMYLTVWLTKGNANVPYNDFLNEMESYLPVDYLFKIPQIDYPCSETVNTYRQVISALRCLYQKESQRNNLHTHNILGEIDRLLKALKRCEVKDLSQRCDDHLSYVKVPLFKKMYEDAYKVSNDEGSCSCPDLTTTVPITSPIGTNTSVQTKGTTVTINIPSQPTATTNILTYPTTITMLMTKITSSTDLEHKSPISLDSSSDKSEKTFSAIAVLCFVIVVLICIVLHLYLKNRQLRKRLTHLDQQEKGKQDEIKDQEILLQVTH